MGKVMKGDEEWKEKEGKNGVRSRKRMMKRREWRIETGEGHEK